MIPPNGPDSLQRVQNGTNWTELEMAALGCDDLFGSLLVLDLLHYSGNMRAGSPQMEGKGASKN